MRKAACCPFQSLDCHMRNHSPPMVVKARSQNRRPEVRASVPVRLAEAKAAGESWRARKSAIAPIHPRSALRVSQRMMPM